MGSPVVTAFDTNLLLGSSIFGTDLFIASDPDNDPISVYQIFDANTSTTSGFFQLNGTALAAGVWQTITAADIGNLLYFAGTAIQSDQFRIRVFDGNSWSSVSVANLYTVRANTTKPTGKIMDFGVTGNEVIAVKDLIVASDPDGYPIQKYRFLDREAYSTSGYFVLNGVAQQQGTWFTVNAADLDALYYVAAAYQQTEVVDMKVYDGAQWSDRDYAFADTRHNANRPVVFYSEYLQQAGLQSAIATLFDWTDEDGNTIKTYRFFDRDAAAASGYISVNGIKQPAKQWIDVPASMIDSVTWTNASDDRIESFSVQVYDGRYKSQPMPISIQTIHRPGLNNTEEVLSDGGVVLLHEFEETLMSDSFDQVGGVAGFTQFQVVDLNSASNSARLILNGVPLPAGTVINLTPAQFDQVVIRGGAYEVRSLDDFIVRAFNVLWTPWTRLTAKTEPEYDTALATANNWANILPDVQDYPYSLNTITYSFMQATPNYNTGPAPADLFIRFTNTQRAAVRNIMGLIERVADVHFLEVPDSQVTSTGTGGLIRFGDFLFPDADPPYYSFSFSPADPVATPEGGDVWVNAAFQDINDLTPGTLAWTDMARQILMRRGHERGRWKSRATGGDIRADLHGGRFAGGRCFILVRTRWPPAEECDALRCPDVADDVWCEHTLRQRQ